MTNHATTTSSAKASNAIRFLRACYESDNREMAVTNLLKKSVRHLVFLDGEEHLLCDLLPRIPVDRDQAVAAQKEAHLHQREKSLLYCAFPIVGHLAQGGKRQRTLCAPLLFYPATLAINDSSASLEIDLHDQRVNTPVLNDLIAISDSGNESIDEQLADLPRAPFKPGDVQLLAGWLQDALPKLDALGLSQFPKLRDEKAVRHVVRKSEENVGRLACLPACALGLFPNSPSTRGVLYELEEIAKGESLSAPLQVAVQGVSPEKYRQKRRVKHRVPTVLSEAQQGVLESAATAPLSLVIGPPGTGKSYTIAATAIDHLSRGESVLIACRTQQAVDVIGDMIDKLLGPNQCVIRGSKGQNQPALKEFLEQMLQGIRSKIRTSSDNDVDGRQAVRELNRAERLVDKREEAVIRHLQLEQLWGELSDGDADGWFMSRVNEFRRNWVERSLRKQPPIWDRIGQYQQALQSLDQQTREMLKQGIDDRIEDSLKTHRRELTTFLKSLRTRSSTRQEKLFSEVDPRILFGAFPIWLAAIPELSTIVPLSRELFDVAIVDEATQCDMASCLPVVQRAKRAVVVGDPQQLRHVSFLSTDRLEQLADGHDLSEQQRQQLQYREKSILDLLNDTIATQDDVHFLNEHFRSLPQIIRFSNEQFYGDSLSVMRQTPETVSQNCVIPKFVPDGRKDDGTNEQEATRLVETLSEFVDSQSSFTNSCCQSIGVLSPFRDQVDLLAKILEHELPLEAFERHRLRVGTAHAFQGDERDVMFLSFVVDAKFHSASFRFLEQPNVLNVAVTRARHLQYVFHSVPVEELSSESLLRRYLAFIGKDFNASGLANRSVADRFMQEVMDELQSRNFRLWPNYELAGQRIDLVVGRNDRTIGVDLIGYNGQFSDVLRLERYRILHRAGFAMMPLPCLRWQQDRASCLGAIERLLDGAIR